MWREKYICCDDGAFHSYGDLYKREDRKILDGLQEYIIVFEIKKIRFYCHIHAVNNYEALGIFFVNHEDLTYNDIVTIIEQNKDV